MSPDEKSEELPLPTWALLVRGLSVIVLIQLATLLCLASWNAPLWFVMIFMLASGLCAFGYGLFRLGIWVIYFLIVSIAAGACAMMLGENLFHIFGGEVRGIPVRDVQQYESAARFEFSDAKVKFQYITSITTETSTQLETSSRSTYSVVPVVGADWSIDQPIRLWVVSRGALRSKHFQSDSRAGLRVRLEAEAYSQVIQKAKQRYNLQLAEKPVFVIWGNSLEELIATQIRRALALALSPVVLWFLGVGITRGLQVGTGGGEEPEKEGEASGYTVSKEGIWLSLRKTDRQLREWLRGDKRIPRDIQYIPQSSATGTAGGLVALFFAELFCLAILAALLYGCFEFLPGKGLRGWNMVLLGATSIFAWLVLYLFPAAILDGRRIIRLQKSGRFRDGIYFLRRHLLYHACGQSLFVARNSVREVTLDLVPEGASKSRFYKVLLEYTACSEDFHIALGDTMPEKEARKLQRRVLEWSQVKH